MYLFVYVAYDSEINKSILGQENKILIINTILLNFTNSLIVKNNWKLYIIQTVRDIIKNYKYSKYNYIQYKDNT